MQREVEDKEKEMTEWNEGKESIFMPALLSNG